jgi:DNA repair protein RadC
MKKAKAKYPLPIREWSEDDRPREKLLKYGEHTLSNAELQELNAEAVELAGRIAENFEELEI